MIESTKVDDNLSVTESAQKKTNPAHQSDAKSDTELVDPDDRPIERVGSLGFIFMKQSIDKEDADDAVRKSSQMLTPTVSGVGESNDPPRLSAKASDSLTTQDSLDRFLQGDESIPHTVHTGNKYSELHHHALSLDDNRSDTSENPSDALALVPSLISSLSEPKTPSDEMTPSWPTEDLLEDPLDRMQPPNLDDLGVAEEGQSLEERISPLSFGSDQPRPITPLSISDTESLAPMLSPLPPTPETPAMIEDPDEGQDGLDEIQEDILDEPLDFEIPQSPPPDQPPCPELDDIELAPQPVVLSPIPTTPQTHQGNSGEKPEVPNDSQSRRSLDFVDNDQGKDASNLQSNDCGLVDPDEPGVQNNNSGSGDSDERRIKSPIESQDTDDIKPCVTMNESLLDQESNLDEDHRKNEMLSDLVNDKKPKALKLLRGKTQTNPKGSDVMKNKLENIIGDIGKRVTRRKSSDQNKEKASRDNDNKDVNTTKQDQKLEKVRKNELDKTKEKKRLMQLPKQPLPEIDFDLPKSFGIDTFRQNQKSQNLGKDEVDKMKQKRKSMESPPEVPVNQSRSFEMDTTEQSKKSQNVCKDEFDKVIKESSLDEAPVEPLPETDIDLPGAFIKLGNSHAKNKLRQKPLAGDRTIKSPPIKSPHDQTNKAVSALVKVKQKGNAQMQKARSKGANINDLNFAPSRQHSLKPVVSSSRKHRAPSVGNKPETAEVKTADINSNDMVDKSQEGNTRLSTGNTDLIGPLKKKQRISHVKSSEQVSQIKAKISAAKSEPAKESTWTSDLGYGGLPKLKTSNQFKRRTSRFSQDAKKKAESSIGAKQGDNQTAEIGLPEQDAELLKDTKPTRKRKSMSDQTPSEEEKTTEEHKAKKVSFMCNRRHTSSTRYLCISSQSLAWMSSQY